ncbi:MAG: SPOR domain-containing protein, partial [Pseudomonadota bacterium]
VSAELPEPAEVQIDAAAEALAVRQAQAAVAESLAAEIPVDLESENLEGDHDVDAAEQDLRSDLSAAFEAELSQLGLEQQDDTPEPEPIDEPETAPIAAEVAGDTLTAQTANTIVSRASAIPNKADLDDEFAKAFAKELDLGSLSKAKPATQANPEPLPIEPEQAIQDALQEEEVDWSGTSQGDALPDFDMPGAFEGAGQVLQEADLDVDANAEHYSAQEDNSEKRRGGFKLAAGALGAALVVGAGAIAYSYFSGSPSITAPVTIKADSDPVKVKPDDPGGTTIANQDKAAYERVTGEFASDTRQETLVKSTETPVDVPGRDVEQTNSTTPATASQDNKEENRLSPNTQTREFAAAPVLEPRRVKTVTVNPDGTVVKPQAALPFQAAEPAGEPDPNSIGGAVSTGQIGVPATRPSPAENSATVTAAAGGNAPIALAPNPVESRLSRSPLPSESSIAATPAVSTSSSQPGSAASPTTAPAQTETASVTPAPAAPIVSNSSGNAAAAGNWAVQISSQRTAEDAQTTYQRMREQYSEVIGNQQMSIQRAEIEGKGVFFRVRVMAQTREEALDICSRLKSAGGSCFVTQ